MIAAGRGRAGQRVWGPLFALALVGVLVLALRPVDQEPPAIAHLDKLAHLATFVVLWLLGARAGVRPLVLGAWLLAYGGAIELLQGWTPTREPSWGDWLADGLGLALGYGLGGRRPAVALSG